MNGAGATLIDGRAIGRDKNGQAAAQAAVPARTGHAPLCVSIPVGDVAAAQIYGRNQARAADGAGVNFESRACPADAPGPEVAAEVNTLNADARANGINRIDTPDGPRTAGDADRDSCQQVAGPRCRVALARSLWPH